MNKPNQEIKTESQGRTDRAGVLSAHHTWLSAKKGVALALVAVLLIVSAAAGNFTGTNAASTSTKAKSTWVMTKGNKYSYYLDSKGKKVAKIAKKSGKYYYYTYNKKTKKWTKWTSKKGFKGKTNSIQKLKGNYFYVKKDGSLQMKKGWKKISKTYKIYIGSQGNVIVTYKKKNGKWYYKEWRTYQKTENGKEKTVTGFKKVSKELRTLSDGKIYYFNKNGVKITAKGWKTLADGRKAYVNAKGIVTKVKDADGNVTKPEETQPTEELSENEVKMSDGVVLNLDNFPVGLTVEDASYNYIVIYAEGVKDLGSDSITYVINGGNTQTLYTKDMPNLDSINKTFDTGFLVPNWDKMMVEGNMTYGRDARFLKKGQFVDGSGCALYFTAATNKGSFTVDAYYKGTYLRTCTVTVTGVWERAKEMRDLVDTIEKNAWTEEYLKETEEYYRGFYVQKQGSRDTITSLESLFLEYGAKTEKDKEIVLKLGAVCRYTSDNFNYFGDTNNAYKGIAVTCIQGAEILCFAARDLGLEAFYVEPEGEYYYSIMDNGITGHHKAGIVLNGVTSTHSLEGYIDY